MKLRRDNETLVQWLARTALVGLAITPALVFLLVGYFGSLQMASDDARIQAKRANTVIADNPDAWTFVAERLIDQIEEIRHERTHTVLSDLSGKVLADTGEPCHWFCLSARAPLMDFGQTVGELSVAVDFRPWILRAMLLGMGSMLIALLAVHWLNRYVLEPLERTRLANTELAFYDPLTHLPNRRLLMDRLGQALIASNRSQQFGALMILDLDHFKVLNDTQGHGVGDQLLAEVAQRLLAYVQLENTVARLGGDEFTIVAEGLGGDETSAATQAEMIAERIRLGLNQPYLMAHNGKTHHASTSIGIALFRGAALPIDVLLKQADLALYQAKEAGRNSIRFFNPEMQAAIEMHSVMEHALRIGLEVGEFELHYQPQVDAEAGLVGAEALLRWFPKDRPAVSPFHFIPVAEQTGLIIPLGRWVMETACRQLKAWEGGEHDQRQIAINISACQFHQADFVELVRQCLDQTGANPARLKLELTESVVLKDVQDVVSRMREIRALGVQFSLDDFGTGFSSLSYLKQLPLDQIKIDQSFVRDITTDANDAAIVRAIIAMSQSLGIEVIAEGVETEAQREFLAQCGCSLYQGYLFGKAVPIAQWP